MEKSAPLEHIENGQRDSETIEDLNDPTRNRKLNRRLDLRVLPLLCWVYLLNFLGTIASAP